MSAPIAAADVRRTVLPHGLVVLVRPARELGAVAVCGYVRAGAMFDGGRDGLARFVGASLIRGTRRRTGPEIAEALDAMGASLTVGAGIEVATVAARSLAADLPAVLGLIAEVLTAPAFAADEVAKVRSELLTALRINAQDTRQVAERLFRRAAYPAGHPHAAPPDGDEATLAAIDLDALRAFHAAHYRPDAALLAIVGDVDPAWAADLAADAFAAWAAPARPRPAPDVPPVPPPPGFRREEAVLGGKSQTDLVLGVPGVARGDPDYYAFMMANLLMGQLGMMGRIGQAVREQQGMAYYAFSDLRAGLLAGPWWVKAGVNPANLDRAVDTIVREIRGLQVGGPAADELEDARTYLVGSLAVRLETAAGMAQTLADMELFDLGLDYLERYPAIIRRVDRDAIVAASRRFTTDACVLATAGPARTA